MYSEKIKYLSYDSNENTHVNKIRNSYFENRRCFTNVLDFLDQEVVIVPGKYFSYAGGLFHSMIDDYTYADIDEDRWNFVYRSLKDRVNEENGYHLSVLDNYITIVAENRRCIFTNKYMGDDIKIIGTIIWVKNFNELLKKYSNRNLKRVSKAIICPHIKATHSNEEKECLDEEFFFFMNIYKPDVIFKYSINTYISNVCIDVYNKLAKIGLNGLVDKYIISYKQCDGYGKKGVEKGYSTELCKCGGLRAFCYLDI